ncbi:MAG: 5'/3'-nucleotidase SurE [Spirochaetales bacterium]
MHEHHPHPTAGFPADLPYILITNDDGVESPGIHAAVRAAAEAAPVLVAAPTTQQSAKGRALSGNPNDHFHPIDLELGETKHPVSAWHIDATPALTVEHALRTLCTARRPTIAVSGINFGENLGTDIGSSGTVGAAFQAAANGVPALAISRATDVAHHFVHGDIEWEEVTKVAARWIARVLSLDSRPFDVLKIDIPDNCSEDTGERLTTMSRSRYFGFRVSDPDSHTPLNATETFVNVDAASLDPESDVYAVHVDGLISITPLVLERTGDLNAARRALGM